MTEFLAGPTMVLDWVWSGGTVNLKADYRTCEWNPSISYVDVSAGQDTQVGRLTALKDATASIGLIGQSGGTAIAAALAAGNGGTLTISPEGTATGKRKIIFPAYCDGAKYSYPYAGQVDITSGFTGSSVLGNFSDTVY